MDINQALQEFGLSQKESDIYTTLLQLGGGSILDVAKNSSLKRPTIYSGIESLEANGLVHRKPVGKRTKYIAEPPSALQTLLKRRERQLSDLIPQLEAITNVPRGTKPEIRYFGGKDAVEKLYSSIFAHLDQNDSVDFITSTHDLHTAFPQRIETFNNQAEKRGFKVRELLPQKLLETKHTNNRGWSVSSNPKHEVRFLPEGHDLFDSEIVIFRDQILIISFRQGIFGISIRSQHVVDSFKTIFKLAWSLGTKDLR